VTVQNEPPSRAEGSLAWLLANGIVLIAILVGLARLDRTPSQSPALGSLGDAVALEQVRPDWWETRRAIYHEIPARVLYRLPDGDRARARVVADGVWAEFDRINSIFNSFDPTSEVGRLNDLSRVGGGSVAVSGDLLEVLGVSQRLWEASDGRFDPTVWPLKELWREAVRTDTPPSSEQLAKALAVTGFGKLSLPSPPERPALGDPTLELPAVGLRFDFGGVAKGYAVGCVESFLRGNGVEQGLVQLGGEVSAFGDHDGKAWRVGVQHPRDMNALWGVIAHRETLRISTSGNYRQQLKIAGNTYYHIFDPRDGRPVSTRVLGVTTADLQGRVSSAFLDGAATAIAVMGAEAGLALARRLGIDALILVDAADEGVRELMTEPLRAHYERTAR
jgi:thiamine biosynthesis lipoprotein